VPAPRADHVDIAELVVVPVLYSHLVRDRMPRAAPVFAGNAAGPLTMPADRN
jgi:hypothetical protein